ncbi:MAG: hypothetical protein PHV74_08125 [Dehalococcoidia bacterium]|nr:hypothetical protein [Dehalococcoidia bacterium]
MESTVVLAALFVVTLLLSVAVYDTSPPLRRLVGRLLKVVRRSQKALEEDKESATPANEAVATPLGDVKETPKEDSKLKSGRLRSIFRRRQKASEEKDKESATPANEEAATPLDNAKDMPKGESKRKSGRLRRIFRRHNKPNDAQDGPVLASLGSLRNAVDDMAKRLAQVEAASGKIAQVETGLAKVSGDTQVLSEDFKDVLGSLRVSIDRLESRLEQVSSDHSGKTTGNEGFEDRISQLEGNLANVNASVESLPQEIQSNERDILEIRNRLESISTDLHRTLGYGIQKAFRCECCGSEGLVASQVTCSKCGTASMWGWWPPSEGPAASETEANGLEV